MSPRRTRLRRWMVALLLYLGAVALGVGSAWWVIKKAPWLVHPLQVGAWKTDLQAGSQDAGMYTRASVAVLALLALGRDETMYFLAMHDDQGHRLRSRCSYRIDGVAPQARWWSITAYADDMYLFDAPNQRYSLNGTTARLNEQGRFSLLTGPTPPEQAAGGADWLPTPGDRGLVLTLRLYNPSPTLQASPATLVAPSIVPVGACS